MWSSSLKSIVGACEIVGDSVGATEGPTLVVGAGVLGLALGLAEGAFDREGDTVGGSESVGAFDREGDTDGVSDSEGLLLG